VKEWTLRLLRLIGSSLVLIFTVIVLIFILLELSPADPLKAFIGDVPVSEEFEQRMIAAYGLDKSPFERFFLYLGNLITGDLGHSIVHQRPVADVILERLGNTLILTLPALVISSTGGIILGTIAARTRKPALDNAVSIGAIVGFSLPSFWLALLLILVFSLGLGWLPSQGMAPFGRPGLQFEYLILPLIALSVAELGFKTRIMRSSMIEVLGQDYIDTARSKGLTSLQVLRRHGVLNAMLPMVSVIGYSLGFVIAGSVVIEKVFSWPGMGLLLYDSITKGENLVVIGIVIIMTVIIVIVNALTDVTYGILDPRIRAKLRRRG